MYEYQIPVRILRRVTLKIVMESATIYFAKQSATKDGRSVRRWTMYNSLKTFSEAARSWSTNKLLREDLAINLGTGLRAYRWIKPMDKKWISFRQ